MCLKGENISFGYKSNNLILNNVNISLGQGEVLGLIGDSGSDIKAGKKCGAVTYLYVAPEFKKQRKNKEADYAISDLRDVLKELKV